MLLEMTKQSRKYKIDKKNGVFIKTYSDQDLKNPDILQSEYEKGTELSQIINYPCPLRIEGNSIYYQLININNSLFDILKKPIADYSIFEGIGKNLRIMHDHNLLHGDFSPKNIIFDNKDKIWFIDASFSEHNTNGEVLSKVDNIYKDISLFLMHLKISKPLYAPWHFFNFKKNRRIKNHFLRGYFINGGTFDKKENLEQENYFLKKHIVYRKKKGKLKDKAWIIIAAFFIACNNFKKR
jgi:serine/threonine-protein kinase RIO1